MSGRRTAAPDGQLRQLAAAGPALRSRDLNGIHSRANSPLLYAKQFLALRELIARIDGPRWAAGTTAAALLGFDGFALAPPFHVVVERGRNVTRIGHVVHTARAMNRLDVGKVDGVPCTSATRTIIDLAATQPPAVLATCIESALRDRLTSEDFVHRRLVELRRRGRRGPPRLLEVLAGIDVRRGGHSWLEREFQRLLHEAGLPAPAMQQILGRRGSQLIRVDCRFPGTTVVVELLGYQFHRSVLQMQADAERMNQLLLGGFQPYQFTYLDVVTQPAACLETVRAALIAP